jgi:hypothetical protein
MSNYEILSPAEAAAVSLRFQLAEARRRPRIRDRKKPRQELDPATVMAAAFRVFFEVAR